MVVGTWATISVLVKKWIISSLSPIRFQLMSDCYMCLANLRSPKAASEAQKMQKWPPAVNTHWQRLVCELARHLISVTLEPSQTTRPSRV